MPPPRRPSFRGRTKSVRIRPGGPWGRAETHRGRANLRSRSSVKSYLPATSARRMPIFLWDSAWLLRRPDTPSPNELICHQSVRPGGWQSTFLQLLGTLRICRDQTLSGIRSSFRWAEELTPHWSASQARRGDSDHRRNRPFRGFPVHHPIPALVPGASVQNDDDRGA